MQLATSVDKQQFFVAVDKVEAIAGNLAAWSQLTAKEISASQHTMETS